MKRRLNLLCLLLMISFITHAILQINYHSADVNHGFKEGYEMGKQAAEENLELPGLEKIPRYANLLPTSATPTDSLYNTKTGEYIPASYRAVIIEDNKGVSATKTILLIILSFFFLIILLITLIKFFRLILAVNRSRIFEWENVRRLRHIAWLMILIFICNVIVECINLHQLREHITLMDYRFDSIGIINASNLILGSISLVLSEVFAMGIRLKEQQELTI